MKKLLVSPLTLCLLAGAVILSACNSMSLQEKAALAGATAGNVYATYELGKAATPAAKTAAISALTDLAAELPNIPLGKVSTFKLGALQAELAAAKADLVTNPAAQNQIGSLIALISNNQGTVSSGIVTADQTLVFGAFQNVATGITNAVQFAQGQASVAPAQ